MSDLNDEQKYAFELMSEKKNVFITGPGGTGKTFLINKYYDVALLKYKHVYKTSSTGTSAILIGGTTLHSWAGVMLGEGEVDDLISKMKPLNKLKWINTQVLFIDEISMINPDFFDKLEEIARKLRKNSLPFGGIQIIITGDFYQLPVVKSNKFCFEALSWKSVVQETVILKKIVRQNNQEFQSLLNNIRFGKITPEQSKILESRVGIDLTTKDGIEPTILFPKNKEVQETNDLKLAELIKTQKKYEYKSKYFIVYNKTQMTRDALIEKIKLYDITVPDHLILAKGAQVMFRKNIDVESGIANGSRGVVIDFKNGFPIIKLLNGLEFITEPVGFEYEINKEYKIIKEQLPLKLAWAATIHSCQGATMDYVKADVGSNIFEYGQAYVVLSRVRDLEGLTLISYDVNSIKASPKVLLEYPPEF